MIWRGSDPMPTADRAWRPTPPEHLDHQVGAAVDHLRVMGEFRHGVDHAEQLDDAVHPVEVAERLLHHREQVDPGEPGMA